MPFDPIGFKEIFQFISGREGLRVLARALRAPMPEGFEWDFGTVFNHCGTVGCAMGLAMKMWGLARGNDFFGPEFVMAKAFDIPVQHANELFFAVGVSGPDSEIEPAMVADAIDCYLDSGDIWPENLWP